MENGSCEYIINPYGEKDREFRPSFNKVLNLSDAAIYRSVECVRNKM